MIQRNYTLTEINRAALNETLGQALGGVYGGYTDQTSQQGFTVTVYLSNEVSQAQIDQLNSLMASHDPRQLTGEQQARQAQEAKLAAARRDYQGSDLDPADYSGENASIQTLARKIAWLEQEVMELQGGVNGG